MPHRPLIVVASVYPSGTVVRVAVLWTNTAGTPTDPTTVSLEYRLYPDGDVTTLVYATDAEVVRDSAGAYHVDLDLSSSGKWRYKWTGVGNIDADEEGYFVLSASNF